MGKLVLKMVRGDDDFAKRVEKSWGLKSQTHVCHEFVVSLWYLLFCILRWTPLTPSSSSFMYVLMMVVTRVKSQ